MSSLFVLLSSSSTQLHDTSLLFLNSIIIVPAPPRPETGSPAAQGFFLVFFFKKIELLSFLHNLAKSKAFKKEAMTKCRSLDTSIQTGG